MRASQLRLPAYSLVNPIDRTRAREDRILINIGNWFMEGTNEKFSELVANLHLINHDFNWMDTGPVFQQGRSTYRRATWEVRGGDDHFIRPVGSPLFSGKLIGQYDGRPENAGREVFRWRFHAELSINPTRAALHQDDHAEWFDPESTPFKVLTTSNDHFDNWEPRLTPSDNVLIGGSHKLHHYDPEDWPQHAIDYFEVINAAHNKILQEAHESAEMENFRAVPWMQLREIENYFEFYSADPVREVLRLEELMRRLGGNPAISWADPTLHRFEIDGHSPCIRLNIAKDATIKVYAKTAKRMRFEVTKKRAPLKSALGGITQSQSFEDYGLWMQRTADAAHHDLSELFRRLAEYVRPIENPCSPEELISKVFEACVEHPNHALVLLRQLVYFGHISRWKHFTAQKAVRTLRRWRVLGEPQEVNRTQTYPLAPEYADAARALRGVFNPPEEERCVEYGVSH